MWRFRRWRWVQRAYSFVGQLADHVGRLSFVIGIAVLLFAAGALVWGRMSDWPAYALYMTTVFTLGVGAQVVMIALRVGRGQVTVNVAVAANGTANEGQVDETAEIESEGILWKWDGYHFGRAHCAKHPLFPLTLQFSGGIVGQMQGQTTIGSGDSDAKLFCPEPPPRGHTVTLEVSMTVDEARRRVEPRFEALLAERNQASQR